MTIDQILALSVAIHYFANASFFAIADGTTATTRNPRLLLRNAGGMPRRKATRNFSGVSLHEPPRMALSFPLGGPVGLLPSLRRYSVSLNQSLHHSHTLPVMSYKPF